MIEFDGYIFGAAEKRFWARSRNIAQNVLIFAVLVLLPMVFRFAERAGSWVWLAGYCSLFLIIPLLLRIPKSEKEKRTLLPKKTPGERCSWLTTTRSAPFIIKVPLLVMYGIGPRKTSSITVSKSS